jgi:hypothetical protein
MQQSVKDRGYQVQREILPGEHATVTARVDRYGEAALIPGDTVLIRSYSNAGFRGIEAHVQDMYGRDWYGVPAGILSA